MIDNDNFDPFDPRQDGIDFYESLKGMQVTIKHAMAVGPTNRFGEVYTVPHRGLGATGINVQRGITIQKKSHQYLAPDGPVHLYL